MSVDNACKSKACRLTTSGFGKQILVLGEERTTKHGGTVEQLGVAQPISLILERGQYINPLSPQPHRDRTRHLMVHVERERHSMRPRSRSRAWSGVGCACCRIASA